VPNDTEPRPDAPEDLSIEQRIAALEKRLRELEHKLRPIRDDLARAQR
jgi:hypothetical protein